jgi:hypothetical protein
VKTLTKVSIAVAIIAVIVALTAQSVVLTAGPEVVLEWDAVTTLEGGDPIPAGDTVSYTVSLDGDVLGTTDSLQYPITLPGQGLHTFSVRTILTRASGDVATSEEARLSVVILYRPSRPGNLRVNG